MTTYAYQTGLHSMCVCVGGGGGEGRNSRENKDLHFVMNFHFVLRTIMIWCAHFLCESTPLANIMNLFKALGG